MPENELQQISVYRHLTKIAKKFMSVYNKNDSLSTEPAMTLNVNFRSRPWLLSIRQIALATLAMLGVIAMQKLQLERTALKNPDPKQAEQQEATRLKLLTQAPSFGFDNLLADWVFLNFLQYYGDTPARSQTDYSLSPQYFDIITQRDPRFVDAYLFLSGTLSYQLGEPALAVKLMDRGTTALSPTMHPRAYEVWRFKGLDQLLLLGDTAGSIHSHDQAAQWATASSDRTIVALAPLFQQTADFLRQDPNSVPVRFQAWSSVYYQAVAVKDKQTQERAKQEIVALGGRIKVEDGEVTFDLPSPRPPQQP